MHEKTTAIKTGRDCGGGTKEGRDSCCRSVHPQQDAHGHAVHSVRGPPVGQSNMST